MADQYLMALDAGTGAGRCVLLSLDGKHLHSTYQEWTYVFPSEAAPMGAAFDAPAFWDTFCSLSRRALQEARLQPEQVIAITSTSQREGCVFLDRAGLEVSAGP